MKPTPLAWTPADGSLIVVPAPHKRTCSKCGGPKDKPGQRYCKRCHAEYMRAWRGMRETVVKQNVERGTLEVTA